ncbi:MAG: inorganic diphosphatase [Candidatus Delongbacteria bacterium]|nr:inorganic diphosphatase [Candidatus Delongbacteria bacterium]
MIKSCVKLLPVMLLLCGIYACSPKESTEKKTPEAVHFWHDTTTFHASGMVNALIEIPAGSDKKYELDKTTGELKWETLENGRKRHIQYLPYPANYGMIPRTLLPESEGGDDDPLDVIILGPTIKRGTIVPCRIIGVLLLTDSGEQDDKLIAVRDSTAFSGITNLDELDSRFPGVKEIIKIWFTHYKGDNITTSLGWKNSKIAYEILEEAVFEYKSEFTDSVDL